MIAIDPGHQLGNSNPRFAKPMSQTKFNGKIVKGCNTTGTATNAGFPEATFNWKVAKRLRDLLQARGAKVVSVDVPSGMDCDNGTALGGTCVEADITVTMVAPKVGFVSPAAARLLGTVVTVPIGGPPVAEFLACAEGQRLRPAAPGTAGTTEAEARTQPPA